MIIQRLIGAIVILAGVILSFVADHTVHLVTLPIGLILLFSKELWI